MCLGIPTFPKAWKTVLETRVGAVIGTHGGPGCIGVAYFETLPEDLHQVLAEI